MKCISSFGKRKRFYTSLDAAMVVSKKTKQNPYLCTNCGMYHLTSKKISEKRKSKFKKDEWERNIEMISTLILKRKQRNQ